MAAAGVSNAALPAQPMTHLRDLVRSVRLLDKDASLDLARGLDGLTGRVDHGDVGSSRPGRFAHIPAVQPPFQTDVGKHHVDRVAIAEQCDGGFTAISFKYPAAGLLEIETDRCADQPLVLDDEDGKR